MTSQSIGSSSGTAGAALLGRRPVASRDRSQVRLIRLATLAAVVLAWEALARSGLLYEDVVPSWLRIIPALGELLVSAAFYRHLLVTGAEVLAGMLVAFALAVPLGLLFGVQRFLGCAAQPYVMAVATTPKIVFLPIVMLAFDVGPESKVAIGVLSAFFPIVLSTTSGVLQVRPIHVRVGRSFNLSPRQMVTKIYLPSLVLPIAVGVRLGLGVCIIGVLLGEIKLFNAGLGFLANDSYNLFRIPELHAMLIVIFALAVLVNTLLGLVVERMPKP